MNGAESLVRTLIASDVDVCFANPGTSEMHFVAALDHVAGMRCVLGLFEGVVTGAADGYWRIAGKPAATLLHLGPGLGNGLANLHNAKKARSGIVNIVGEHAAHHIRHDAPLTADIEGIARPMSHWVRTSWNARDVAADGARAVEAARTAPGQIATLVLPADTAWNAADAPSVARAPAPRAQVAPDAVRAAAAALKVPGAALLLGGIGVHEEALAWAGRIAAATGCRLLSEYNCPRYDRGAGRVITQRVPYVVDLAVKSLADLRSVVLAGGRPPVSFFAYPDKPSLQAPADCVFTRLAGVEEDIVGALEALAAELGAHGVAPAHVARLDPPGLPSGKLTQEGIAAVLGALIPEDGIVVDESVSTGRGFAALTTHARPHGWLTVMGGSIGFALPAATGAAIAGGGRKVIALEGDGSGMYTLQALWTMARENLPVTVLVFANRSYNILKGELASVGAGAPGQRATDMLTLDRPDLDWRSLARGMGVEAGQATTLDELAAQMRRGLAAAAPYLIEVVL
ncbi:MAG: acetolactate synthase large subunit [Burkholderiales bacterium]|nr:acetolactate synthase large subunit [Burkholderiales bacterium]